MTTNCEAMGNSIFTSGFSENQILKHTKAPSNRTEVQRQQKDEDTDTKVSTNRTKEKPVE